ncbi:MAG: CRISPR-associated endonuclease Cas1 [candidate division WOR-3 bacterium]|jgi:CRISPR-associated exonuclease Cas4
MAFPAQDEFNALLNYAYGILYSRVEKACVIAGLDPYVGIIHTDNYNKKSLVFDIIENYRVWAEEVVINLFASRRVKKEQFDRLHNGMILNREGRALHAEREKHNPDYLRKKIGCVRKELSVYLASPKIRVRGVVDEVLTLKDGTMAPLDYKYTEYRDWIFRTHRYQSVLYGLLITEIYKKPVRRGYICYIRNGSKLCEVIYHPEDYMYIQKVINEIFRIISRGEYPESTPHRVRCIDCCYKNICV